MKSNVSKVQKQAEAKRNGVITHRITISIYFEDGKFFMLSKRYKSTENKGNNNASPVALLIQSENTILRH